MCTKMFDILKFNKFRVLVVVLLTIIMPVIAGSLILRNLGRILFGFGNPIFAIGFIVVIAAITYSVTSFINDVILTCGINKFYENKLSLIKYIALYILEILVLYFISFPVYKLVFSHPKYLVYGTIVLLFISLLLYIFFNFIITHLSVSDRSIKESLVEGFDIFKSKLIKLISLVIVYLILVGILAFVIYFTSGIARRGIQQALTYYSVVLMSLIALSSILSFGIKTIYFEENVTE